MALRGSAFLFAYVVDDRNQPVTVLAKIEDHVSIHIIGIFEDLFDFKEISPSHLSYDFVPSPEFSGRIRVSFFGLDQVLASYNVHGSLPKNFKLDHEERTNPNKITILFNLKTIKDNFSYCKDF
jgi:hypothetical protein